MNTSSHGGLLDAYSKLAELTRDYIFLTLLSALLIFILVMVVLALSSTSMDEPVDDDPGGQP